MTSEETCAALVRLGFERVPFGKPPYADGDWMHPKCGLELYLQDMVPLKSEADLVTQIYRRGMSAGRAFTQKQMKEALGIL